ncbi:hypothetical protein ACH5RR_023629 [Cinchona calisaya]|uniref:Uncharacterized protein n=1 Tax=Cinchona calisaya TaxID=153742 RepID=A0ABD2ZEC2_9GENT
MKALILNLKDLAEQGKLKFGNSDKSISEFESRIEETPQLKLGGHYNQSINGYTRLSSEIKSRQAKGVKVILSIGQTNQYWDVLSTYLSAYSNLGKKVYLTTAPQCPIQMPGLDERFRRKQLTSIPAGKVFLGLPVAPDSVDTSFILASDLTSQMLPAIKDFGKYGGVMLRSKFYDDETGYSSYIKSDA